MRTLHMSRRMCTLICVSVICICMYMCISCVSLICICMYIYRGECVCVCVFVCVYSRSGVVLTRSWYLGYKVLICRVCALRHMCTTAHRDTIFMHYIYVHSHANAYTLYIKKPKKKIQWYGSNAPQIFIGFLIGIWHTHQKDKRDLFKGQKRPI